MALGAVVALALVGGAACRGAGARSVGAVPAASLTVTSVDTTFDAGTRQGIPLRIWTPTSGGPYPVIVMSHGGGGSGGAYEFLVKTWAQHGYVVMLPTHQDSIALAVKAGHQSLRAAMAAARTQATDPTAWTERAAEIHAVIDQIDNLASRLPELAGKVDAQRLGVAGHSLGAFTSMLIAGVQPQVAGAPINTRDPRPAGFVFLSPQGVGVLGLSGTSYQFLDRPALFMTGTLDTGILTENASGTKQTYRDRLDGYRLAPPGNKVAAVIDGANHFTFSGPGSGAAFAAFARYDTNDTAPATYDAVVWATLRFWDQVLKGQPPGLSPNDAIAAPATMTIQTR